MKIQVYRTLGKQVKGNRYFHLVALEKLEPHLREQVQFAVTHAGFSAETEFNVIKIDEAGNQISLLDYEHFFDSPFPVLKCSYVVNLVSGSTKRLSYDPTNNPPILHRKELLLPHDHPQVPLFATLTQQLEAAGRFCNTRRIGFAREWQERLQSSGFEVRDHQLVSLNGVAQPEQSTTETLARHRTALQRYALSAPMQALHRHGYLDETRTVFDYGCGKGDDVPFCNTMALRLPGGIHTSHQTRQKSRRTSSISVSFSMLSRIWQSALRRYVKRTHLQTKSSRLPSC